MVAPSKMKYLGINLFMEMEASTMKVLKLQKVWMTLEYEKTFYDNEYKALTF